MSALAIPARPPTDTNQTPMGHTAFAFTCLRVPIGISILLALAYNRPLFGALALTLFVVIDIGDGKVARAADSDTAYRRGLDSLIDRATVLAFFLLATVHVHGFLAPAMTIAIVNLIALPVARSTWRKNRIVLKAPSWHHSWSITFFIAGILYFIGDARMAIAAAAFGAMLLFICTSFLVREHVLIGRSH
jgi:phosphatidylglycerophosphate synthase